jgi:hypothetical protein
LIEIHLADREKIKNLIYICSVSMYVQRQLYVKVEKDMLKQEPGPQSTGSPERGMRSIESHPAGIRPDFHKGSVPPAAGFQSLS